MYTVLIVCIQKYEDAERFFQKAIQLDPDYSDAKDELNKTQIKRLMVH